jgi:glyoxylase-like metal-dependent hydrolase (beta-lactamase superfamily II)
MPIVKRIILSIMGYRLFSAPLLLLATAVFLSAVDQSPTGSSGSLPPGLTVVSGPVNGALIERGGKLLAIYGDPSGRNSAEMVLLTHARRDAVWAARDLVGRGARVVAPEKETGALTDPGKFWEDFKHKRFHDYSQQSSKMPVEPMAVSRRVKAGDVVDWSGLSIRVLDTPGYTRGAVSYVVELGGKKVAFTGDLRGN